MKTLYLYYMGNYQMKFENLSQIEADSLIEKYNGVKYPGYFVTF